MPKHTFYSERDRPEWKEYYSDGDEIDIWRFDYEHHNGPQCKICSETKCHNCHPDFYDEECEGE